MRDNEIYDLLRSHGSDTLVTSKQFWLVHVSDQTQKSPLNLPLFVSHIMKRFQCYLTQKSFMVVGDIAIIESAPGPDLDI